MDSQPSADQQAKEFEDPKSLNIDEISEYIMPHLLNMYGSRATAKDFEIYAPEATFEDPLMHAHGVKQIKSAFYSLPKKDFRWLPQYNDKIQKNFEKRGSVRMRDMFTDIHKSGQRPLWIGENV